MSLKYEKQDRDLQVKQNQKIDRLTYVFLVLTVVQLIVDIFK